MEMRDITIKSNRIKTELIVWLILLVITYVGNIYSIIKFETSWRELYSSLGYVLVISFVLYGIVGVLRLLILGVKSAIRLKFKKVR